MATQKRKSAEDITSQVNRIMGKLNMDTQQDRVRSMERLKRVRQIEGRYLRNIERTKSYKKTVNNFPKQFSDDPFDDYYANADEENAAWDKAQNRKYSRRTYMGLRVAAGTGGRKINKISS